MANRNFNHNKWGLEKGRVELYAELAIGATGAPTVTKARSQGIKSVVRNTAGNYTVTLTDAYTRLMSVAVSLVVPTGVPSTGTNIQAVVRSSTTNTIIVEFLNSSGVAAEIVSGVIVQLKIDLKNSTV
jgi:hypothetical protein